MITRSSLTPAETKDEQVRELAGRVAASGCSATGCRSRGSRRCRCRVGARRGLQREQPERVDRAREEVRRALGHEGVERSTSTPARPAVVVAMKAAHGNAEPEMAEAVGGDRRGAGQAAARERLPDRAAEELRGPVAEVVRHAVVGPAGDGGHARALEHDALAGEGRVVGTVVVVGHGVQVARARRQLADGCDREGRRPDARGGRADVVVHDRGPRALAAQVEAVGAAVGRAADLQRRAPRAPRRRARTGRSRAR